MSEKMEINGVETEVFTTEEITARVAEAVAKVEGEWKPKVDDLTGKLSEAEKHQAARAIEMGQFRKLSDDQRGKLDEANKVIYDNMVLLNTEREKNAGADKKAYESAVETAIRSIVGKNEVLFQKTKDVYDVIGLEDITPEQIVTKAKMSFGAIGMASPDLLASAGFRTDGAFAPPETKEEKKGNPDVDEARIKQGAAELGVQIELTAEQKKARGIV